MMFEFLIISSIVPEKIFEFGPRVQKMGLTIEKAEFPHGLAEFVSKKS